jgi:hypothetical protein
MFNNNEIIRTKINIDDLYERKNQIDDIKLKHYNKILNRAHSKIKQTSRLRTRDQFCFFLVPEFLIGVPSYDTAACIAYIIDKLQENGFFIKYTHPNLLFISWQHYIDKRKRMDFKKQNGYSIDAFGNPLAENNDSNSKTNDVNNPNSFMLKKKGISTVKKKDDTKFKKISSYNPTGNLIYNTELLKKIEDTLK